MAIKNVLVVGGGGNLSPAIIDALVKSPHNYTVSVLSRAHSTYQPPSGVNHLKTDYTHDSLLSALKGQNAVVSAIAGTAIPEQKKIIDAAIEAGVQRFLPSEFGSDTTTPLAVDYFPGWAPKVEIRDYLKSKQDKIEWTVVFNGFFFDWGLKVGFIPVNGKDKTATIFPKYKDVRFSATNLEDIGKAIAQALSPEIAPKTANQILRIRTLTTSQSELLATYEKATGEKFKVTEADLDAAVSEAKGKLSKGDFSGIGTLIVAAALDTRTGNDFDKAGNVSNDLLQLPSLKVEDAIKPLL
ncbi:conserved hypothetical protein [Talaromyces stipitatus ATCC 10500]|uniref:NmrA-like domain-containing protein n=1 Tax=Talaromyces stipitatus (strain ATCC 10500 / CBS 375.48 / QM 6759 / NRRL 1006) TaxID=441959 RepID=B8LWH8_TALSN|nr:uncharacterized protein TSTA_076550 [Talaromyces stipitatus ATCC 10500]EED24289.1 conserved hypothetical protein [Talaromyces stipitatus ATCC 10500]